MLNKNLLKGKIIEKGYTLQQAAVVIGCNYATFYRKMNGESDFTRNEIQLLKQWLGLTSEEVETIFFAPELTFTQVEHP